MNLERILATVERVHESTIGLVDDGVRTAIGYGLKAMGNETPQSRYTLADALIRCSAVSAIVQTGYCAIQPVIADMVTLTDTSDATYAASFLQLVLKVPMIKIFGLSDLEGLRAAHHTENGPKSTGTIHPYSQFTRIIRPYATGACVSATASLLDMPPAEMFGSLAMLGTTLWPWAISLYVRDTQPGAWSKAKNAVRNLFSHPLPVTDL